MKKILIEVEVSEKLVKQKGKNSFISFDARREDNLNPNYVTTYGPDEEASYGILPGNSCGAMIK